MKNLAGLGQIALDSGIIKRADMTLELDNDKIAQTMQGLVLAALGKLPQVEMITGMEPMATTQNDLMHTIHQVLSMQGEAGLSGLGNLSRHTATIRLHHDRLAEGIAKGIDLYCKNLKQGVEGDASQFSYKVVAYDDGKRIQGTMSLSLLKAMQTRSRGNLSPTFTMDGILDPSDVPRTPEEVLQKLQMLMTIDPESGETVIDGQNLLKLMQAHSDNVRALSGNPTLSVTEDEAYANMKRLFDKIPGATIERDGDTISFGFDMKKLSDASKRVADHALSQVKGITLVRDDKGDQPETFVTTARLDFKQLTRQAMETAAELLRSRNGVRVDVGSDATRLTFNTDLRDADRAVTTIQQQVNDAVQAMGRTIAQEALGARPGSAIKGAVQKHFLKGPEHPGPQL